MILACTCLQCFNKFSSEAEEWTWWEKLQILAKIATNTEFDNNNPALWRIGPQHRDKGIYLAVTDADVATRCVTKM